MQSLRVKKIKLSEAGSDFREATKGHVAIKVRNLFPNSPVPCDVYFPYLQNTKFLSLEKTLTRGQNYDPEFHDKLVTHAIRVGYIRKEDEPDFFEYFSSHLQKIVHSSDTPAEVKTQLIYNDAENIVKKVFRERPGQTNIRMGKRLVEHFAVHLASDEITSEALLSIFSKDYYTFTHSVQVSLLGMSFGRFLGWPEDEVKDYGLGSLFHDVGKSSIDDAILNKPGKLDRDEFQIMMKHPILGYEQIRKTQVLSRDQLSVVLHHHEAMDGSGYPDGREGDRIHKYARVARIIDCYDALTTNRPYKSAMPMAKAIRIMKEEMGPTFDRDYLEQFMKFIGFGEKADESHKQHLQIDLGVKIVMEPEGKQTRWNGLLVGMEPDHYLILRVPALAEAGKILESNPRLVCRYIYEGNVYQFRTRVVGQVMAPIKLLFVHFPRKHQVLNLRKHPRIDCFLPAFAGVQDSKIQGVLLDISMGGCQFTAKNSAGAPLSELPIGSLIEIRTTLFGEQQDLPFAGTVKHVKVDREKTTLGIAFDQLDDASHQRLSSCMENLLSLVH